MYNPRLFAKDLSACPAYDCSTTESKRPADFPARFRQIGLVIASVARKIRHDPSFPRYERVSQTSSETCGRSADGVELR